MHSNIDNAMTTAYGGTAIFGNRLAMLRGRGVTFRIPRVARDVRFSKLALLVK